MATRKITHEEAMKDLKLRKHQLDQDTAAGMVKKFKSFRTKLVTAKNNGGNINGSIPDLPLFLTYNKKAIQDLLKKPGCTAIRMYPAISAEYQLTLVLVAVDETGENIIDTIPAKAAPVKKGALKASKAAAPVTALGAPGGVVVDEGQTSPPYPAPKKGF